MQMAPTRPEIKTPKRQPWSRAISALNCNQKGTEGLNHCGLVFRYDICSWPLTDFPGKVLALTFLAPQQYHWKWLQQIFTIMSLLEAPYLIEALPSESAHCHGIVAGALVTIIARSLSVMVSGERQRASQVLYGEILYIEIRSWLSIKYTNIHKWPTHFLWPMNAQSCYASH